MKKLLVVLTVIYFLLVLTVSVSAKNSESKVDNLINPKITTKIYIGKNVTLPESSNCIIENNYITVDISEISFSNTKTDKNKIVDFCKKLNLSKSGYSITDAKINKVKGNYNWLSLKVADEDIDVYSSLVWTPNKATVKYNLNGGNVKNKNFSIDKKGVLLNKKNTYEQEFFYNESCTELLSNNIQIYKENFIFVGWSLTPNGKNMIYPNKTTKNTFKGIVKGNQELTLYAQWLPEELKIVYKNPDGKSKIFSYTYKKGINYIAKDNIYNLSEKYHSFMGWATTPKGNVTIKPNSNISYSLIFSNLIGNKLYLYPVIKEYILPIAENDHYLYISSPYGERLHPITKKKSFHSGIDLAAPIGTDIYASVDGEVIESKYSSGYGLYVTIRHYDGRLTRYAHCNEVLVKEGEKVKQGQVIAKVGNTGQSTGSHLHFEVIINNEKVNPEDYVDFSKLKQ